MSVDVVQMTSNQTIYDESSQLTKAYHIQVALQIYSMSFPKFPINQSQNIGIVTIYWEI